MVAEWSNPVLGHLERGGETEDGPTALDGGDTSGGERQSVTDALHVIEDGDAGIAGAQEIGMQRMDPSLGLDSAGRGHQRLSGHLSAEHALAIGMGAAAPEDVELDLLEIEQVQKCVDSGLGHPSNLPHPRPLPHRPPLIDGSRESRVRV